MNTISVIIPTYNEAENMPKLLEQLYKLNLPLHVITVDDNSPDGTGTLLEKLKKTKYKDKLTIIHRKSKLGLGSAYLAGFKKALANPLNKFIMTMDADFSHNPNSIPSMIEKINNDADVVIGSRYITGGGVNWHLYRRILSKGANIFAAIILNLGIKDVTSGFRCYKRNVLKKIPLDQIKSNGYSFLEELLFYAKKQNFHIEETPIFFDDRTKGKSKLSKKEILYFFITILRLRFSQTLS